MSNEEFDKKNDKLNQDIEKTIRDAEKLKAEIAKRRRRTVKGMWEARKLRKGRRKP